jgi:aspartokinase-like uncharacterized kinase
VWVVKIGGSLSESDDLSAWLDVLAVHGRGQVVIVPGGGPFADQVRRSQARWGFDDVAAHHMALLAMEQYGRMLAGIRPEFKCASTLAEIRQALSDGYVPVWLPSQLAGCAQDIPASWDITSDSLAAWLANALAAECLTLVKSVQPTESVVLATALAECGLVDPLFPVLTAHARYEIRLMGKDQYPLMRMALLTGEFRGTKVDTVAAVRGVNAIDPVWV